MAMDSTSPPTPPHSRLKSPESEVAVTARAPVTRPPASQKGQPIGRGRGASAASDSIPGPRQFPSLVASLLFLRGCQASASAADMAAAGRLCSSQTVSPAPSVVRTNFTWSAGKFAAMAVGVLALQGSFKEHITCLRKLGVDAVEIRKPEQLAGLSGLIIPGGESTTMAKLAEKNNLFPALREFASAGIPIWGTCAGLIFLADRASGVKKGGQELLGGLDCTVHRNFFGSQLNSFEMELAVPALVSQEGGSDTCRAVFIRAPAIVDVGPSVEVLAEYPVAPGQARDVPEQDGGGKEKVIVAVKQKNMLATAFHPELTSDLRWHSFFMKMINNGEEGAQVPGSQGLVAKKADLPQVLSQVGDLPVFKEANFLSLELQ